MNDDILKLTAVDLIGSEHNYSEEALAEMLSSIKHESDKGNSILRLNGEVVPKGIVAELRKRHFTVTRRYISWHATHVRQKANLVPKNKEKQ